MADTDANRGVAGQSREASGKPARPPATVPMLERRTRMRRAVWYSILVLLVAVGLMMPFFLEG